MTHHTYANQLPTVGESCMADNILAGLHLPRRISHDTGAGRHR